MWHQNAVVFENAGFGRARTQSSPAVVNGTLVGGSCPHHQNPVVCIGALVSLASVCNVYLFDGLHVPDSTRHGSLIGLAFNDYGANLQVSGSFHFPRCVARRNDKRLLGWAPDAKNPGRCCDRDCCCRERTRTSNFTSEIG